MQVQTQDEIKSELEELNDMKIKLYKEIENIRSQEMVLLKKLDT